MSQPLIHHGFQPWIWAVIGLTLALAACSRQSDSPEAEIRAFVARAQAAAEDRDARGLRALIADDYADAQGHNRQTVENLIRLHILRHQTVHLLTRIRGIELAGPERARVSVAAAMAGRPVANAEELVGLSADLYRFDLELIRRGRGDWQVRQAAWEPARLDDFW